MPAALSLTFEQLISRGGHVMWPLLAMSVIALTLLLERGWYFARANRAANIDRTRRLTRLLREGDHTAARAAAESGTTIYHALARDLIAPAGPLTEARTIELIESHRRQVERFMSTLSTIITAAPMLGILGTVLGIITSFEAISRQAEIATAGMADPRTVGSGIAEALLTTATGLIIAVVTLFPYNALRTQVDRTLNRLETLAAAALEGTTTASKPAP